MDGTFLKPDIRVPEQKTASLSFCDTTPKAFKKWAGLLPMANIGEVSRQLYHAIIELNQLFLPPQQRLQLLDVIREKIHFVCTELSSHFIGTAVSMPEKQRKIANLAQALQLHLSGGYKLCVIELLNAGTPDKNRKALVIAIHRSIAELSGTILRAYQLYCPTPPNSWLDCHKLYKFALAHQLTAIKIDDATPSQRNSSSIDDAYKRILLLGCARPSQLRQTELSQLFTLFEPWTDLTDFVPDAQGDSLFVVNMRADKSPVYRSLLGEAEEGDFFSFDSSRLSAQISQAVQTADSNEASELTLPPHTSDTLLIHLAQALGTLAKRNFNRVTNQGSLELCVGLTAVHYFMAGRKTLNDFTRQPEAEDTEDNMFIRSTTQKNDAWAGVRDADDKGEGMLAGNAPINFTSASARASAALKNAPCACRAKMINTSPGGFCIVWDSQIPSNLQTGEILGVREQSSQPWSVAVVRWIRQIKNEGTQIGIELQAPTATPCAVRLIQKLGNSSAYLRGLMLPEISVINQPSTLIVPRIPFQSGNRITLLIDDQEEQGQLLKKMTATGSINQFEIKLQSRPDAKTSTDRPGPASSEDEFDSLWPLL
ncbi:GTPase [Marinobacter psychrophilus]|uniref:GTPase n=1 Tax=Marinobacter psychrophilus TaxID=330734 RepID=UPI001B3E939B|nr:GTPase [Marinobacter psychrophilus]MBQ0763486.1 GTPase [Marinobacter psychrophilus]MBQ0845455.1 GTPase [Marinobacter psychrophilus]